MGNELYINGGEAIDEENKKDGQDKLYPFSDMTR